jgi:F-type H+-transporting ATPase subunit epsilon
VAGNRVSILSEHAEMSHEIDLEKARHDLERAQAAGENDDRAEDAVRRAQARIRAVEKAS